MNTYILICKYSCDSLKDISPDRTDKAIMLIRELGGEVKAMYAVLGSFDAILIVTFPSVETAMRASLGLSVLTGISFTTLPAVSVNDFDRMLSP